MACAQIAIMRVHAHMHAHVWAHTQWCSALRAHMLPH